MPLPKNRTPRIPAGFEDAFRAFQKLPNVGKATAEDLVRLRIRDLDHLAKQKPLALYQKLCRLDNARHDPCVIDVFMAVIEHAQTDASKPWWKYTPERKAMAVTSPPRKRRTQQASKRQSR